jgi:hypothetical protein
VRGGFLLTQGVACQAVRELLQFPVQRAAVQPRPAVGDVGVHHAGDVSCVGCGAHAARCEIHHIRWVRHEALIVRGGCKDPPPACRSRSVKLEAA